MKRTQGAARLVLIGAVWVCGLIWPGSASAQSAIRGLSAEQFTVSMSLLPDGSINVRETVAFRFRERTFSEVEREIPLRRLDGIIDVRAYMDGKPLPEGRDEGQVRIRTGRRSLRVTWHFPDTVDQTRTFTLEYRAMGALAMGPGRATLAWMVLPSRHRYPIDEARVEWRVPESVRRVEPTRLDDPRWVTGALPDGWMASRTGVAVNETVTMSDAFDLTTVSVAMPAWQTNADRSQQMGPAFFIGAVILLVMGLGVVGMTLFRYHRPQIDAATILPADAGSIPPGLGTALVHPWVAVGPAQLQATLLDLAKRGLLKIREAGGEGAKKSYEIVMTAPKGLRPHEQAMADALWPHLKQGSIELKKGWKHLLGAHTAYRRAVFTELGDLGFLDKERQAAGRGLRIAGLWVTLFGVVGLVVFGLVFGHLGDVPLLVPGAVLVSGVVFLTVGQTMSVFSVGGLTAAAAWRARQKALKQSARGAVSAEELDRWLPASAGFGMAPAMLKAAKSSGDHPIAWLGGLSDPSAALMVILSATSAGSHGGVAGGGGAAGGGASSAR